MATKRKPYHLVNEKDFETIKTLFGAGLGASKINQITGRSFGVIGLVKKSDSIEDYRQEVKKTTAKLAEKKANKIETIEIPEIEKADTPSKAETLSDINDTLQEIKKVLERLATAWESRPAKRGIFDR